MSSSVQHAATVCFILAILHTFSASFFQSWAARCREGSVLENLLHLMGEVEVVFGLWAGVFLFVYAVFEGHEAGSSYVESLHFTEPLFVFIVMSVTSAKPVLELAGRVISGLSKVLPLPQSVAFVAVTLSVGPLLGSFITEPAAMTVSALLLSENLFSKKISSRLRYLALGVLFVNVSVGGTLTPFAAPPILMVAAKWSWDLPFVFKSFGWKGGVAVLLCSAFLIAVCFKELRGLGIVTKRSKSMPWWVMILHLLFLAAIVAVHTKPVLFVGIFLFFLGLVKVTGEYQNGLKISEALLVAFFLGGLVVLGAPQRWWLEPLLGRLDSGWLFLGSIGLTGIVDNAALTYLGAQVPGLSELSKFALVAGAVVGGGLTVIANAPNPAGYSILAPTFKNQSISAAGLLAGAAIPTLIASLCFWLLP